MTREIIFACVLSFGGFGCLSWNGFPKRSPVLSAVLSLPVGAAVYTFGSALAYSLSVNRSDIGLYLMIAIALSGLCTGLKNRKISFREIITMLLSFCIVAVLMILLRAVVAPIFTYDSYRIVVVGQAFGSSVFSFGSTGLASFPLMITNFQAGGDLFNLDYVVYLPVVTGVLATVGATIIISDTVSTSKNQRLVSSLIAFIVMGSFWAVTFMLRSQLGYLNSHLLMAGYYTLGFAFCLRFGREPKTSLDLSLCSLLIGVVAFIRLEGLLFVSLLLFALMSFEALTRRQLLLVSAVTLIIPGLWYARLAIEGVSGTTIITPRNTIIMLLVAASPSVINFWKATRGVARLIPHLSVIGLAAIFCVYLLTKDTAVESSLKLISNSIATGYWGAFWWAFGPLVTLLTIFGPRLKREGVWMQVLGGGFLLILLLGVIRSSPFRIGWGDSGNRMLVHLAPLAVLYTLVKVRACFGKFDEIPDGRLSMEHSEETK